MSANQQRPHRSPQHLLCSLWVLRRQIALFSLAIASTWANAQSLSNVVIDPFDGDYCVDDNITITFDAQGFTGSNTYEAQLSNASGSFTGAQSLGTDAFTGDGSGSISATIPNVSQGTGYRIRVRRQSSQFIGDTTATFTINTLPPVPTCPTDMTVCSNSAPFELQASPAGIANQFGGVTVGPGDNVFNPGDPSVVQANTIWYQYNDGTCSNMCIFMISVNPSATAEANGPYVTCGVAAVNIMATANGPGQWSSPGGSFGNPNSPSTTFTPTTAQVGTTVTLTWTTIDPDGTGPCLAVLDTADLTIGTPPTAPSSVAFLDSQPFCVGQLTTMEVIGGSTNGTFEWSCTCWDQQPTPGSYSNFLNVQWQPSGTMDTIALTITDGNCSVSESYPVTLSSDTASCPKGIFFFPPYGLGVIDAEASHFQWGTVSGSTFTPVTDNLPIRSGVSSQTMFDTEVLTPYATMDTLPTQPQYKVRTSRDGQNCWTTTTAWVSQASLDEPCLGAGGGLWPGLEIKIYPNPHTGGALNLEAQGTPTEGALDMELYDLGGRMVLSEQLVVRPLATLRNDLDHLERGLYIMRLRNAQVDQSLKLVLN